MSKTKITKERRCVTTDAKLLPSDRFYPSMDQVASLAYIEETTPVKALSTKIFIHLTKKESLYITYAPRKMCPLSCKEGKLQNSDHTKMS